jgi:hypothetical protein
MRLQKYIAQANSYSIIANLTKLFIEQFFCYFCAGIKKIPDNFSSGSLQLKGVSQHIFYGFKERNKKTQDICNYKPS